MLPTSNHPLKLTVSLDRPVYRLGDDVVVTVRLNNTSGKSVKGLQVAVRQHSELRDEGGHVRTQVKATLSHLATSDGFPLRPGQVFERTFTLPLCEDTRMDQGQIALDGQLHDEGTSLASSARPQRRGEREQVFLELSTNELVYHRCTSETSLSLSLCLSLPLFLLPPSMYLCICMSTHKTHRYHRRASLWRTKSRSRLALRELPCPSSTRLRRVACPFSSTRRRRTPDYSRSPCRWHHLRKR